MYIYKYRFTFNGKEHDDEVSGEGNDYDFGARIYDGRLGRFLSVDPLTNNYSELSPYCFAANNAIRLIDINGEAPGDPFASARDAAIDFAKTYNDNSIFANKEYSSVIYSYKNDKGDVFYSYTVPEVGGSFGLELTIKIPSDVYLKNNGDVYLEATIHTHSAYDPLLDEKNDEISTTDLDSYKGGNGSPKSDGYVVTPSGKLFKYDLEYDDIYEIKDDYESNPLHLPADKNDPDAKDSQGLANTFIFRKDEPIIIKNNSQKKENKSDSNVDENKK